MKNRDEGPRTPPHVTGNDPVGNTGAEEMQKRAWTWQASAPARHLLAWARPQLDEAVGNVFGFHAVQLGMPAIDALAANRMPDRIHVLCGTGSPECAVWQPGLRVARFDELPFDEQSIDLVVMSPALDGATDPHRLLREVDRVLRPEGQLVVLGINPWSLWGLRHQLPDWAGGRFLPHPGALISAPQLRDWIRLLGFEPGDTVYGCHAWPLRRGEWLTRAQRLYARAGERWWPVCGAGYLVRAVKRVQGMRLIGPAWQTTPLARGTAVAAGGRQCRAHLGSGTGRQLHVPSASPADSFRPASDSGREMFRMPASSFQQD